jgi:hypothetical protein
MYRKVRVFLVLALFALSAFAGASGVQAKPEAVQSLVVSKRISPAEQKEAHAKAAEPARPLQSPVDFGSAVVIPAAEDAALGPPGRSPSGAAARGAEAIAQQAYPDAWTNSAAAAATETTGGDPAGLSQEYSSYAYNQIAALQTPYPHRWVGRVTFTTPAGTSYCSGTSISGNVLLTAAHCLYDTTNNRFYSNWAFQPAFRNGGAPFGTFAATTCWVLTAWVNLTGSFAINTWSRHDVGVCKMGNNSAGQTLNAAVGWMGRQWDWPYVRHFHTMGYPFRNYNDALLTSAGLLGRLCAAESFQQTTETRGMGCSWGRGISGGPWVKSYTLNVIAGAADGVNSGLFIGTQNMYGPRFNSNNIVPLCNAAVC